MRKTCKLILNLITLSFKVLVFNFMYCKVCKSRVLLIYSRVPDMVGARGGESNQTGFEADFGEAWFVGSLSL